MLRMSLCDIISLAWLMNEVINLIEKGLLLSLIELAYSEVEALILFVFLYQSGCLSSTGSGDGSRL